MELVRRQKFQLSKLLVKMVINLLLLYRSLQLVKWSFLPHSPIHPFNGVLCIFYSPLPNEGNLLGLSFSLFFVVNTGIEETRTRKVKRKHY